MRSDQAAAGQRTISEFVRAGIHSQIAEGYPSGVEAQVTDVYGKPVGAGGSLPSYRGTLNAPPTPDVVDFARTLGSFFDPGWQHGGARGSVIVGTGPASGAPPVLGTATPPSIQFFSGAPPQVTNFPFPYAF